MMIPVLAAGIAEAHHADEQQGRETDQKSDPGITFEHGNAGAYQRQYQHDDQDKAPLR
jgi:hypothetical protein